MTQQLTPWDADDSFSHPDLVWWSTLDDRYRIEVQRTGSHQGVLRVFDHAVNDAEIKSWPVALAYGASFSPDAVDISDWQKKVVEFIDCAGGG